MAKTYHKIKQLIPIGDEWGIEFDEELMEGLGVDGDSEFELTIEDKSMVIRPVPKVDQPVPSKP